MKFHHYYGHIYMWLSIFFGITGPIALIYVFGFYDGDRTIWGPILLFIYGMGGIIASLTFAAMAYVWWTPKWQRNEARGRSLYSASEPSALLGTPWESVQVIREAQEAGERDK